MLDRQLRQVPRWLRADTATTARPAARNNRPLPGGDVAKHPALSADGALVVWDAYRANVGEAERLGEIHVRGADLGAAPGASRVSPPGRAARARPRSAYNSVLSADGRAVAFETAESTYPLAKRVGQMTVLVRDLRTRQDREGQPRVSARRARRRARPSTRRCRPTAARRLRGDGQRPRRRPSRNGLWVVDRKRRRETLVDRTTASAPPTCRELAGDGAVGRLHLRRTAHARATQVCCAARTAASRARLPRRRPRGRARRRGDAYDPRVSRDGSVVAFTTRAANLGGDGRRAKIYVRDLRAGHDAAGRQRRRGDALEPRVIGRRALRRVRPARAREPPRRPRAALAASWCATGAPGAPTLVSRRDGAGRRRGGRAASRARDLRRRPARRVHVDGGNLDARKPGRAGRGVRARRRARHDDAAEPACVGPRAARRGGRGAEAARAPTRASGHSTSAPACA